MTTLERGAAETTFPGSNNFAIGTTIDASFMQYTMSKNAEEVAIPVKNPTNQMHDIGLGTLCVSLNTASLKKDMSYTPDARTFGRLLIVGQCGNIPHGLKPEDLAHYTPEEQNKLKRQRVLSFCRFVGVANGNAAFNNNMYTPLVDGLPVIMFGVVTVTIYAPNGIKAGAPLCLALPELKNNGRAGLNSYPISGVERYPFTLVDMDTLKVHEAIAIDLKGYTKKLENNSNSGSIFRTVQKTKMLDEDRSMHQLAAGVADLFGIMFEALVASSFGEEKVKDINVKIKTDDDDFLQRLGLGRSGLGSKGKADILTKVLSRLAESEALVKICGGIQDTIARRDNCIGFCLGEVLPEDGSKRESGMKTFDIFLTKK